MIRKTRRKLRVLDFDIETRRIGFHNAGKFRPDGCEPITIAASWLGTSRIMVWMQPEHSLPEMLEAFSALYQEADMVTGHYIRKFDLPIINGSLLEHDLPLLAEKLVCDTKIDLFHIGGLSQSQENLAGMLALVEEKYKMADFRWRQAARLDPEGVVRAKKRASEDVRQHKELRARLIAAGALGAPSVWSP